VTRLLVELHATEAIPELERASLKRGCSIAVASARQFDPYKAAD